MLPLLFTLEIPAPWAKAAAVLAALALVAGRAFAFRRRAAQDGAPASLGAALRDDRWMAAGLAAAVAVLWSRGLLDGPISLPVHTYGLALAAGFIVAVGLAQREARRQGLDADKVGDLAFWVLVSALVGSRVYFILVNWREYLGQEWLEETRFGRVPRLAVLWEGGLVFYGGLIAAALAAWIYLRRHRLPFLRYADVLAPSVALGHAFGRLGCFSAGCCWGRVSDAHLPWLFRFPPASLAYQTFAGRADPGDFLSLDRLTTRPLHPTQLYEAAGELGLFLLLVLWVRPRQRFAGQLLATWLVAYAVLRTAVEFYRGDVERGVVAGLGVGQWTSAAVLASGVAVWLAARRAAGAPAGVAPQGAN